MRRRLHFLGMVAAIALLISGFGAVSGAQQSLTVTGSDHATFRTEGPRLDRVSGTRVGNERLWFATAPSVVVAQPSSAPIDQVAVVRAPRALAGSASLSRAPPA